MEQVLYIRKLLLLHLTVRKDMSLTTVPNMS